MIQSVFELHDGSGVVVTVGKYVTPNHKDINGNGIEPDYRNIPGIVLHHILQQILLDLCNLKSPVSAGWGDITQRLSQCSTLPRG